MRHIRKLVPATLLVVFVASFIGITPTLATDFSPLPYLVGKSWTQEADWTWTAEGTGTDHGNWKMVGNDRYENTITRVDADSITIASSWTTKMTETATGSWVSVSSFATSSGTPVTRTYSYSGSLTIDRTTYVYTAYSGDYAEANLGHKTSDVIDPLKLKSEGHVDLWWYDEDNRYITVSYSLTNEKMVTIAGVLTKALFVTYTGTGAGWWHIGNSYSKGRVRATFSFDKSTGINLGQHTEGTYSYDRVGGGWKETYVADIEVVAADFPLGAYVYFDSDEHVPLTIDDNTVEASDQPKLFVWNYGSTHTVNAQSMVSVSPGIRLSFRSWNDGSKELTRRITIDDPANYLATYKRQYELTLSSQYGKPTGSGWYDQGGTADVHVDSSYLFVFVFRGWTGDQQSNSPDMKVTMNGPKSLQANWRLDYARLTMLLAIIAAVIISVLVYRRRQVLGLVKKEEKLVAAEPGMKPCVKCGFQLPVDAEYCSECGGKQG